jgi:MtN3 and saliva related transmembrane protein
MHISFALVSLIGYVAAFSTTVSFVPQLLRVIRLKTARDISLGMFLFFSWGEFCWLIYGLMIHSQPVIWANAVTLVLAASILVLKLKYDGRTRAAARRALEAQP